MTHLGLFEGIGGFSLAARWAGWETIAWCEWDKNCQRVLKQHFPNAIPHGDITKTDFTGYAGRVGVLTGGFPCQPFSLAGERMGSEDHRFLWGETLRALVEIKPAVAVFENVFGLTSILERACETEVETQAVHLFSEGDDSKEVGERIREVKQRTLSIIVSDLYEAGYMLPETQDGGPIILCVPACAVNAPHRRDRVWIVAHAKEDPCNNEPRNGGHRPQEIPCGGFDEHFFTSNPDKSTARTPGAGGGFKGERRENDNEQRCEGRMRECIRQEAERHAGPCGAWPDWRAWENFPTKPPVCGGNDGLPRKLDAIAFPKWREFAIGAYGNAIVPQIAYQIFKAINDYEKTHNNSGSGSHRRNAAKDRASCREKPGDPRRAGH